MQLASAHTYPVKSCHRIDHNGSPVTVEPWGLAGDRRWMVVDPQGRCVTQREVPALATVRPAPGSEGPGSEGLLLRATGAPEQPVPQPDGAAPVEVRVFGNPVSAVPAGTAADDWLGAVLDRPVRLVWLADPTQRLVDPAYAEPADRVSFADSHPLLATTNASLDALNDWLLAAGSVETPLPMTRFRPNLVIGGAAPWAEDGWVGRRLRVGQVTFRVTKPCSRCVVTTTDQETGQRGEEPLRVLARHRKVGRKVLFGVNLIPDPPYGQLAALDPVQVLP